MSAGTFHAFHTAWIGQLMAALNEGLLPEGYYAMAEQHAGAAIADVLTLREPAADRDETPPVGGGLAAATAPPKVARHEVLKPEAAYRRLRKVVAIRHASGHHLVALIEVASPGNKDRDASVGQFVAKVVSALEAGCHVLMVDLFPPGPHDPRGLHGAICSEYEWDGDDAIEPGRPLALASYVADREPEAYIQPVGVGEDLPEMPLFLSVGRYINVPLEPTYRAAFRGMPGFWREVLEGRRDAATP